VLSKILGFIPVICLIQGKFTVLYRSFIGDTVRGWASVLGTTDDTITCL